MIHGQRGTRFVIGQLVYCPRLKRAGQLLGLAPTNGNCTVRLKSDNAVVIVHERELRVATWEEVRGDSTQ